MLETNKAQIRLLVLAAAILPIFAVGLRGGVAKPVVKHSVSRKAVKPKAKTVEAHKVVAKGKPVHRKYVRRRVRYTRYRRYSRYRYRIARVHLQPDRIREIQQALIRSHYLEGDPTGKWDAATHDAMLRYQQDNGFSETGLPDAKSLMKLGLGPHPLPPDVAAASPAAAAQVATPAGKTQPN